MYVLRINIGAYNSDIKLKFLSKNSSSYNSNSSNPSLFIAWFRILTALSRPGKNLKCVERPIPGNFTFALYYLLQKLYKHKELSNTPYIFTKLKTKTSSNELIEKLYYDLIVNNQKYIKNRNFVKNEEKDINLLSMTLMYTLKNMPSSLFCDSEIEGIVNFVINEINKNEKLLKQSNQMQQQAH